MGVEVEALKAVGIVVVEEVGAPMVVAVVAPMVVSVGVPIVVAVVAPHLSTEQEFPEESVPFIGLKVHATAHSTARSSTK